MNLKYLSNLVTCSFILKSVNIIDIIIKKNKYSYYYYTFILTIISMQIIINILALFCLSFVKNILYALPIWEIEKQFQGERAAIDVPIYWPAQAYSRPHLCNVESLCRCRRNDWSLNLYILAIIRGYPIQSWALDRRGPKAVTPCTLQMGISL